MADTTNLGLSDAAQVLQELGICKAFGPTGKVNGPNCQRFGHRDSSSGRWSWTLEDLVLEARKRRSASEQVIENVLSRYSSTAEQKSPVARVHPPNLATSRAEIEMAFRQSFLSLESALRKHVQIDKSARDRPTLGSLICEVGKANLLTGVQIAEAWFINAARNSLSHSGLGEPSDSSLIRATQAATELADALR